MIADEGPDGTKPEWNLTKIRIVSGFLLVMVLAILINNLELYNLDTGEITEIFDPCRDHEANSSKGHECAEEVYLAAVHVAFSQNLAFTLACFVLLPMLICVSTIFVNTFLSEPLHRIIIDWFRE